MSASCQRAVKIDGEPGAVILQNSQLLIKVGVGSITVSPAFRCRFKLIDRSIEAR